MLKSFKSFFAGIFASAFAGSLIEEGTDYLETLLEKFYIDKPKQAVLLVSSLYVLVDTVAEDYAAKTNTKIDDKAVAEVKKDLEDFAAAKGFTLLNLDQD